MNIKINIFKVNIIILLIVIIIMIQDWYLMSKRRIDIDHLNNELINVNKILQNNSEVAFFTNETSEKSVELYYKTQFAMVPRILVDKDLNNDTFLIVENKRLKTDLLELPQMDTILSEINNNYKISLLVRRKP